MPLDPMIAERLAPLRGIDPAVVMGPSGPPPEVVEILEASTRPPEGYELPAAAIENRLIDGPHGPIPVRVYRPTQAAAPGIGLVWMHGGAFVGGDLEMPEADATAREIVARTGGVVISVDYRLATEGRHFPIPHDDVHAAFIWAHGAAAELGIDPDRLSIGGASAGANLACAVTVRLRDEGGPTPASVLLAYGVFHAELPPLTDPPADIDEVVPELLRFPPPLAAALNANLMGDQPVTPYAFPAEGSPAGLPRLLMVTCEYDDLRASSESYEAAARAAGVTVESRAELGVTHGHLNLPGLAATESTLQFFADGLLAA